MNETEILVAEHTNTINIAKEVVHVTLGSVC